MAVVDLVAGFVHLQHVHMPNGKVVRQAGCVLATVMLHPDGGPSENTNILSEPEEVDVDVGCRYTHDRPHSVYAMRVVWARRWGASGKNGQR